MAKDNSLELDDFPCHAQAVETNPAFRAGFIRTRLKSRTEMTNFGRNNK